MGARGDFYDYRDTDGVGRVYAVHRRSIHPAMRVCKEWGSLLLNENVQVVRENQGATDWLGSFFSAMNFFSNAQATVVRAFGLGTGVFALWVDLDKRKVRIRHYDARMVIPLTWDEDGVTECAFVTRAFYRGKAVDQLQMHLLGGMGFSVDSPFSPSQYATLENDSASSFSIESERYATGDNVLLGNEPTYRIVTVCFDHEGNELAPALRTSSQSEAFRIALQMLGDLTGFGISYFDMDDSRGFVKTATEASSDNSALMRNIRRHENLLEGSLANISDAAMAVSRGLGVSIPDEGEIHVNFDDSIIQDTDAEKARDMKEVGVTMAAWEYRMRWYGEEEAIARASGQDWRHADKLTTIDMPVRLSIG